MTNLLAIIKALDEYMVKDGTTSIAPVEANKHLDRIGLLRDSKDRPGKPLRDLLRKGMLAHAYQIGVNWIIPHSQVKVPNTHPMILNTPKVAKPALGKLPISITLDIKLLTGVLMDVKNFKKVSVIDTIVPNHPGIYCIRITNPGMLPAPYGSILANRGHNILYIGIASQSLNVRFLGQELRAKGHGTFFRSLGALLGYQPAKDSLKDKANKRNYVFPAAKEEAIINWINANLIVNWMEYTRELEAIEIPLITKYLPLVNIKHNPAALDILIQARAECVRIACG